MQKIWKINENPPKKFLEQFPEYSRLTLQLLWDRGLKTQKEIDEFFNPDYDQDLHDPFLMKGMKKAVERILKAVENKEKITIFGDYDADGVCGTAILSEALNILGAEPDIYIPDRNKEGYGLNLEAVKEVASKGTKLIITVDCGITDFEEIELANKLGVDTVIIDHHQVPEKVPDAAAIVNPQQREETYPFKELAASGVAFKVVQALLKRKTKNEKCKIVNGREKWLLDLVAIATVADMMPLTGENRTLVKYGLVVLARTKRLGLRELMKIAKIANLDTHTLGYIIGPRLNAAGRMDHANTAYELLITNSKDEAEALAKRLSEQNQERQKQTDKIIQEVEARLLEIEKQKLIFEGDENWPVGIVGLIAGRLADKYYRPAVIFQKMQDKSKGSARSIPSFNIIEAISKCRELFDDFGGHPEAAGFTISNKNLEKFRKKFLNIADKKIKEKDLISCLGIDLEVMPEELNFEVYEEIQRFAPFGEGNPTPLFLMRNLKISNLRLVGNNGNHLKCYLTKESAGWRKGFQAIGFGLGGLCDMIREGDEADAVFELIVNEWNGTSELQLKIIDFKKS